MQTSAIVFNTKPILASINSTNHSKQSSTSALFTPKFNRKAITYHPPKNGCRRRLCSVPFQTSRRLSSEFKELTPHSHLLANSQRVSCFHSYNRKKIGVKRFTSGFFADKSTFPLAKNLPDNAEVRH